MTTAKHENDAIPSLQGEQPGIEKLSPGSYTAQRLKHASAQHLHITTRRIFIGPIPEAWIAGHRKSWAKYRPRMLTYSSRTATFNAAQNVSEFRALTGLDSDDARATRHHISFPQPADVKDDDEPNATITGSPDQASVELIPDQASPDAVQDQIVSNEQSEADGAPEVISLPSPDIHRTGTAESYVTAPSKKLDAKTFVTARETLDSSIENIETPSDSDRYTVSQRTADSRGDSPMLGRSDTSDTAQDLTLPSAALKKKGSTESTQALLSNGEDLSSSGAPGNAVKRKDQSYNKKSKLDTPPSRSLQKTPSKQQVLLEVEPEIYSNDDPNQADIIHAERNTTGMVRFQLPEEMASAGNKIKGRISEAKERVVVRGHGKSSAEPGQLLKAERMLIRIEVSKKYIEKDYSEKLNAKAETSIVEKWREYMVTCRKSNTDDEGFVLQMAKTRVLPMLATQQTSKKVAHEVVLHPKQTRANFYSSLDKTIVLWEPKDKFTRIYILRPRSPASSVEWFTFLNLILGWKSPSILTIAVPDLDVTIDVPNPLKHDTLKHAMEVDGTPEQREQTRLTDGHIAKDIISKALQMLKTSEFQDVLDAWVERDVRLGLVWKQYDRLEWVHGATEERMYGALTMQETHELEIRTKVHYPTCVAHGTGAKHVQLDEPAPIEGFLVRQTSQKGRHSLMGRNFFKRLYFSTHNHLLCFSAPGKAVPPKPPELADALEEGLSNAKNLAEKIPLIYLVNPYPIKDGKISWLSDGNLVKRKECDQQAYAESQRAIHLLLETEGYINLCHIKKVRKYKVTKDERATQETDNGEQDSDTDEEQDTSIGPSKQDIERSFEIHLLNGLIIRLQAFDKVARKEWVKRLRELSKYWKLRTAADIDLYKEVRQQNLDSLGIDEQMESLIGQTSEKWEVSRAIASPELFHMCGISCCRQITMSGSLYRKPRMHSAFRKSVVVLCHGRLLIFQSTLRRISGHEQPHILHEKEDVVDLKDSYIYSGSLIEDDLLYQNKTFDSNHPGHNALPRLFRDDNWTSVDEDSTTCFVVWHGRRKSFFKADSVNDDNTIGSKLRYVSSLGVPGRSMVFKARSRAERDHWVTNISMEIERLQQSEDIRIVVSK